MPVQAIVKMKENECNAVKMQKTYEFATNEGRIEGENRGDLRERCPSRVFICIRPFQAPGS